MHIRAQALGVMQAYTAAAQEVLEAASQEAGGDEDETTGSPDDQVHICISLLYVCVDMCVCVSVAFGSISRGWWLRGWGYWLARWSGTYIYLSIIRVCLRVYVCQSLSVASERAGGHEDRASGSPNDEIYMHKIYTYIHRYCVCVCVCVCACEALVCQCMERQRQHLTHPTSE